jgi:acyl-CoA thioester hydrolase
MDRVKIELPKSFQFSTKIPIRITDINYGGHVGNDSFLALIQEARLQFFTHHGYSEMNIEGCSTIMVDAAIEFKAELFYGDVVEISVTANNISKLGFDLFYLLEKVVDSNKIICGKAKTGILCFDYQQKKKVPLPENAVTKFTILTN